MYRAIATAVRSIGETDFDIKSSRFIGFDGNSEGKQYSYVRYFVMDMGRFDELKYGEDEPSFNSHIPMLARYRRMLEKWNSIKDKSRLSEVQVKELLLVSR